VAGSETLDDALGFKEQPLSEGGASFTLKDFSSFRGAKPADVKKWLEQNGWSGAKTNPNKVYNDGMRFTNGYYGEQIRIMSGGATISIPEKRGPYMEISIKAKSTVIELFGNPVLK